MSKKREKILAIGCGLLLGTFATIFGAKELIQSRQLATRGKSTTSEVLETEDHRSRRLRPHTYYVRMTFQTEGGETVQKRVKVDKDVFIGAQGKRPLKVHYLPEDPSICAVGDTVKLRYGNVLMGLVVLFVSGYLVVFFKAPIDTQEATESIADSIKALLPPKYEYAPPDTSRFRHLDLAFYDGTQRQLETRGYRFLGDEENITLRGRGTPRTFVRILTSADQTVTAALYHVKPGWMLRVLGAKALKAVELENWFSDGFFVCTSNAEMAGMLDSPPSIDALRLPAGTTCDMLMEAHQRRVSNYLAAHPGVETVKLPSLAEVHRAQEEQQRIKAEFRKKVGVSKSELERIASQPSREVDQLHVALTKHREQSTNA